MKIEYTEEMLNADVNEKLFIDVDYPNIDLSDILSWKKYRIVQKLDIYYVEETYYAYYTGLPKCIGGQGFNRVYVYWSRTNVVWSPFYEHFKCKVQAREKIEQEISSIKIQRNIRSNRIKRDKTKPKIISWHP